MNSSHLSITAGSTELQLALGDTCSFGRGNSTHSVDLVLSTDRHLHAVAGVIEADSGGWSITNTGSHLVIRLLDEISGAGLDVVPGRTVRGPWENTVVSLTIRPPEGPRIFSFRIESPRSGGCQPFLDVDGGTVVATDLDTTRTYFRVLLELCRARLNSAANENIPEAKFIARKLGLSVRAVEKQIEYLRFKYGLGPDRLLGASHAGLEQRGTQFVLVDLAVRSGDVTPADLARFDALEAFGRVETIRPTERSAPRLAKASESESPSASPTRPIKRDLADVAGY